MSDPFRLDGENAIVTGGSRGIGLAIARSLAGAGANVLICGRDEVQGEVATRELAEAGHKAEFVRADVTAEDDVTGLVERCVDLFGGLSVLVNNAGPTDLLHTREVDGPLGQISPANWRRLQDSALTSVYLTTRAALEKMTPARRGAVVNISSIAARLAMPGFAGYTAGKAGVEALTRAVAAEYGHLGIRCNAIRVGTIAVDHERGRERPAAAPPKIGKDHRPDDWRRASPPAAGDPDDVAHAVRYLVAPASAYVTGAILPVDGGLGCRSLMPWQTPRPATDTE
ncbi:SDR family oxidoreductase [Amycolatopsis sp. K13G38]|uniref:SDR family oxidoreductase n=1 Tax=Amycolatopsis acididurans TaxID=2724524 RepID=A0ABX1J3F1_9PSEU|nr:SDR family NAD(P)-dependent oxidoreductase [Amycolatopsis acididurans]NKQ54283.1 SDR family oxidoreductase [Amycolatopsis acididurans]